MPPKLGAGAAAGGTSSSSNARRGRGAGGQPVRLKPAVTAPSSTSNSTGPGQDRNKVVVRRCPPELPEAVFWQSVEPWIQDEAADWKLYKQGRTRAPGSNKETINSVAYIHFKRQDQIASFAAAYQGHTFRDGKGNRFQVIVQYAPFQKIPPKKVKPDPLAGTIDDDADYLSFVKTLTEPEEPKQAKIPEVSVTTKGIKKTTPLLEELRRKKQETARKKLEGSKQSRSAKRAAGRATATSGISGTSTAPAATATNDKVTAAEAKANKKAEKEKKRKADKIKKASKVEGVGAAASGPVAIPTAQTKAGQATTTLKPAPKIGKGGSAKQKVQVATKPAAAQIPKMTILAPPKNNSESKEVKPVIAPTASTALPAVTPQSGNKPAPPAPATKPKAPISSFDDIVGQFAKQMKSEPATKAPSTANTAGKAKQSPVNDKIDSKASVTSSSGGKTATPGISTTSSMTGTASPSAQSQGSEGTSGRGRGRGSGAAQRGRRQASSAGRGAALSPSTATATPAPS